MTAQDLPDELIESIQRSWNLASRKETLVVAEQLIEFLEALLDYAKKHPDAFSDL